MATPASEPTATPEEIAAGDIAAKALIEKNVPYMLRSRITDAVITALVTAILMAAAKVRANQSST